MPTSLYLALPAAVAAEDGTVGDDDGGLGRRRKVRTQELGNLRSDEMETSTANARDGDNDPGPVHGLTNRPALVKWSR